MIHDGLGPALKVVGIEFPVGHLTRDPHQLLLSLQQAQAQALLGVLDIAIDGFLFAVNFFQPQIAKGRHDCRQKQDDSRQWRQHGKSVLALRRQTLPPVL